jgi:CubicO group peptidase (beta-lactamase class C family)
LTLRSLLPMRRIARLSLLPLLLVLLVDACARAPVFREAKLREIDRAIEQAIAAEKIPGAVLWIEHRGAVYHRAYGNRALVPRVEAMTADTVFDVASLTKPLATAPSLWLLIRQGKVALDAPAARYLPEMADRRISIRHLLTHSSGLRPGLELTDAWSGYEEGVRRALAETPRNAPGAIFRYSDVNFILLGEIVRRVSGQPLDEFARDNVFAPLRMTDTGFRRAAAVPAASPRRLDASIARIAPTERGLRGTVHDPTAGRMGGVAGHAGVFSSAADVARSPAPCSPARRSRRR